MTLTGTVNTTTSTVTNNWVESPNYISSYIDDIIGHYYSNAPLTFTYQSATNELEFCIDGVRCVKPCDDGSVMLFLSCRDKEIKLFLSAERVREILNGLGEFPKNKTFEEGLESFLDSEKE